MIIQPKSTQKEEIQQLLDPWGRPIYQDVEAINEQNKWYIPDTRKGLKHRPIQTGKYLNFSGLESITVPAKTFSGTDYTFAIWLYVSTTGNWCPLAVHPDYNTANTVNIIAGGILHVLRVYVDGVLHIQTGEAYNLNEWNRFVFVVNGAEVTDKIKIFKNGDITPIDTGAITANLGVISTIIGVHSLNKAPFKAYKIQESNSVWTAQDVRDDYNGAVITKGSTDNFLYWGDDSAGLVARDALTVNGNNGVIDLGGSAESSFHATDPNVPSVQNEVGYLPWIRGESNAEYIKFNPDSFRFYDGVSIHDVVTITFKVIPETNYARIFSIGDLTSTTNMEFEFAFNSAGAFVFFAVDINEHITNISADSIVSNYKNQTLFISLDIDTSRGSVGAWTSHRLRIFNSNFSSVYDSNPPFVNQRSSLKVLSGDLYIGAGTKIDVGMYSYSNDIRIHDTVLSDVEIENVFNGNLSGKERCRFFVDNTGQVFDPITKELSTGNTQRIMSTLIAQDSNGKVDVLGNPVPYNYYGTVRKEGLLEGASVGYFDGVLVLSFSDLSGRSIVDQQGEVTVEISGNNIQPVSGTGKLYYLEFDNESYYVFGETNGLTAFDKNTTNALNGTWILGGSSDGDQWSDSPYQRPNNLLDGCTKAAYFDGVRYLNIPYNVELALEQDFEVNIRTTGPASAGQEQLFSTGDSKYGTGWSLIWQNNTIMLYFANTWRIIDTDVYDSTDVVDIRVRTLATTWELWVNNTSIGTYVYTIAPITEGVFIGALLYNAIIYPDGKKTIHSVSMHSLSFEGNIDKYLINLDFANSDESSVPNIAANAPSNSDAVWSPVDDGKYSLIPADFRKQVSGYFDGIRYLNLGKHSEFEIQNFEIEAKVKTADRSGSVAIFGCANLDFSPSLNFTGYVLQITVSDTVSIQTYSGGTSSSAVGSSHVFGDGKILNINLKVYNQRVYFNVNGTSDEGDISAPIFDPTVVQLIGAMQQNDIPVVKYNDEIYYTRFWELDASGNRIAERLNIDFENGNDALILNTAIDAPTSSNAVWSPVDDGEYIYKNLNRATKDVTGGNLNILGSAIALNPAESTIQPNAYNEPDLYAAGVDDTIVLDYADTVVDETRFYDNRTPNKVEKLLAYSDADFKYPISGSVMNFDGTLHANATNVTITDVDSLEIEFWIENTILPGQEISRYLGDWTATTTSSQIALSGFSGGATDETFSIIARTPYVSSTTIFYIKDIIPAGNNKIELIWNDASTYEIWLNGTNRTLYASTASLWNQKMDFTGIIGGWPGLTNQFIGKIFKWNVSGSNGAINYVGAEEGGLTWYNIAENRPLNSDASIVLAGSAEGTQFAQESDLGYNYNLKWGKTTAGYFDGIRYTNLGTHSELQVQNFEFDIECIPNVNFIGVAGIETIWTYGVIVFIQGTTGKINLILGDGVAADANLSSASLNITEKNIIKIKRYNGRIYYDINGNLSDIASTTIIAWNSGLTNIGTYQFAGGLFLDKFEGTISKLNFYELNPTTGARIKTLIDSDWKNGTETLVPNIAADAPAGSDAIWNPADDGDYIQIPGDPSIFGKDVTGGDIDNKSQVIKYRKINQYLRKPPPSIKFS